MKRLVAVGLFVVAALAALGAIAVAITPDPELRNFEAFNEMVHSPAYVAQSENPLFADGMTQRTPVEGTIARGRIPVLIDTGAVALAESSDTAIARGKRVFTAFCSPCHGDAGLGDGPVARRGFPPPPSLLAENARKMTDGEIYRIVTQGRGNMPALAGQVRREDRLSAVAYIRSLQSTEGAVP